ncbi:MAG: tail fiber domain-containing protein [Flavobacteriaceae bacterium]
MKIIFSLITIIFIYTNGYTQVGIGNTNPKASLDISATNISNPANNDGLLIPRIDTFPIINPGIAQQGMVVYLTTTVANDIPGFYYWDNNTSPPSWVKFFGQGDLGGAIIEKLNDLSDGKSDDSGVFKGSSVFLGVNSGAADNGGNNQNVGIGFNSLRSNTSGKKNTANGYQSLYSNNSGNENTAIGYQSMYYNSQGRENTSLGFRSLYQNTSGYSNIAIGYRSIFSNNSGYNNSALGFEVLFSNTNGHDNSAFGLKSLNHNTTGHSNNTNGNYTLFRNTTGNSNIAIGFNAGYNNQTGSHNVYLGEASGYNNITGSGSVFLGQASGYNEHGSNKLYIENSNANSDNALIYGEFDNNMLRINGELQVSNPTFNGYRFPTIDGTNNQVLVTNGNGTLNWSNLTNGDITSVIAGNGLIGGGNIGDLTLNISATNGLTETVDNIKLGGSLTENTTINFGLYDTYFNLSNTGDFTIQDNGINIFQVDDNGNTTLGNDMFWKNTSVNGTILASLTHSSNDGVFEIFQGGSVANRFHGNGDSYINGGNLGIGIVTPAYKLDIRGSKNSDYIAQIYNTSIDPDTDGLKIRLGSISAPVATNNYIAFYDGNDIIRGTIAGNGSGITFNTISDKRLKTNIRDITNSLDLILQIQPRKYEFISKPGIEEYGFIAQELQQFYPQSVSGTQDSNPETNPMMVDYSKLTPLLTAGIKELKKEVDFLKNKNRKQEGEIKALKKSFLFFSTLEERVIILESSIGLKDNINHNLAENN